MVPNQVATPVTEVAGTTVKITWSLPNLNGATLAKYTIIIRGADSQFYSSSFCDGTQNTVINNLECMVPMSSLWASPFFLTQGTLVQVKVRASNTQGDGDYSNQNTAGALVQVIPLTPLTGPSRNEADCTNTVIGLEMPEITGTRTGGSDIISYALFWNQGSGTNFVEVVGYTAPNLNRFA